MRRVAAAPHRIFLICRDSQERESATTMDDAETLDLLEVLGVDETRATQLVTGLTAEGFFADQYAVTTPEQRFLLNEVFHGGSQRPV